MGDKVSEQKRKVDDYDIAYSGKNQVKDLNKFTFLKALNK